MEKLDFKKTLKKYYSASDKKPIFLDIPSFNCLMIDGKGDPNVSKEFHEGIEALYSVSYTLKFMLKKQNKADYGVMGLEGLWWHKNMKEFSIDKKQDWLWTIFIVQPDFIKLDEMNLAIKEVGKKKSLKNLEQLRFEKFEEGLCAQIMHIGPFSEEGPTILKLHENIMQEGYELTGKHHEIYLSDFRKTPPEKLKTIIRQPVVKVK